MCALYKVTINQAIEIDQYPLPRASDLFATLSGGKSFLKLDLSLLDEQSSKFLTINTQRVHHYTRLPFGVASAPTLQAIPGTLFYIDDILITTKDNKEHLHILEQVLQRLQHYRFQLKKEKCQFL